MTNFKISLTDYGLSNGIAEENSDDNRIRQVFEYGEPVGDMKPEQIERLERKMVNTIFARLKAAELLDDDSMMDSRYLFSHGFEGPLLKFAQRQKLYGAQSSKNPQSAEAGTYTSC